MSAPFAMNFLDKNPMLKHVFNIWMQPVYGRLNLEGKKTLWLLLSAIPLLVIAIYLLLSISSSDEISLGKIGLMALIGIAADFILLLIFWFIMLTTSAAQQYSPANAALVPNLQRVLQWAIAIPVIILPLLPAVISFFINNEFVLLIWFFGVIVSLVFVASIRMPNLIFFIAVIGFLPMLLSWKKYSLSLLDIWNTPLLLIPAGLAIIVGVLHWTFVRNDALFKRRERLNKMQEMMKGNTKQSDFSIQGFFASPYLFLLKRQVEKKANAQKLLPFSLGPRLHWTNVILQIISLAIGIGLVAFLFISSASKENGGEHIPYALMIVFPLFTILVVYPINIQNTLYQTRAEQALISLSPTVTSMSLQNRIFLGYVLKHYLFIHVGIFLFTVLACELSDLNDFVRHSIYLVCCSVLFQSLILTRDYGKMQSILDTRMPRALLATLALSSISIFITYAVPSISYWILCSAIIIVTMLLIARQWKKTMLIQAIFPAGRAV